MGLARFLYGLGIPEVGSTVAAALASEFLTFEGIQGATTEQLEAVDGIGPIMSEHIRAFLDDERNRERIAAVLGHMNALVPPERAGGQGLTGMRFVFTGGLERFSRSDAKRLIEENGGRVVGSVSGGDDLRGCRGGPRFQAPEGASISTWRFWTKKASWEFSVRRERCEGC